MENKIEVYGEAPLEIQVDCGTHIAFYALQNFVRKEMSAEEQEQIESKGLEPDEHGIVEQAEDEDLTQAVQSLKEKYMGKPMEYSDVVKESKDSTGKIDLKKASKVWKVLKGER